MSISLSTLFLLACPFLVYGGVINVDSVNGNNVKNCGDAASPCQTILFAIGEAAPGDTISIQPGNYGSQQNVPITIEKQGLSIVGSSPNQVTIDCSAAVDSSCILVTANGTISIENLNITNYISYSNSTYKDAIIVRGGHRRGKNSTFNDTVTFTKCYFSNSAVDGYGQYPWSEGSVINIYELPSTTNVYISNSLFQYNSLSCIRAIDSSVSVLNNTFVYNRRSGFATILSSTLHPWEGGSNIRFIGNEVTQNTGERGTEGTGPLISLVGRRCNPMNATALCVGFEIAGNSFTENDHVGATIQLVMGAYARILANTFQNTGAEVILCAGTDTPCQIDLEGGEMVSNSQLYGDFWSGVSGKFFQSNITGVSFNGASNAGQLYLTCPGDVQITNCNFTSPSNCKGVAVVNTQSLAPARGSFIVISSSFFNTSLFASSYAYDDSKGNELSAGGLVSILMANNGFEGSGANYVANVFEGEIVATIGQNDYVLNQNANLLQCGLPSIGGTIDPPIAPAVVSYVGQFASTYNSHAGFNITAHQCLVFCSKAEANFCNSQIRQSQLEYISVNIAQPPHTSSSSSCISTALFITLVVILGTWAVLATILLIIVFVLMRRKPMYEIQ